MRPRRAWITASVTAALLAGALALTSCGGSDDSASPSTTTEPTTTETETETGTTTETAPIPETPTIVRIVVAGGIPKGGIVRKTVSKGDRVVLVVSSDVADEIHLHGYDLSRDVAAARTARLAFVAKVPGRFEIELEERGVQIGDLTVEP